MERTPNKRRDRNAESRDNEHDKQAVARPGEYCTSRKTQCGTDHKSARLHGIAVPEAMGHQSGEIELEAVDETHDIERRVHHLREVEEHANRAAELGSE